MARDNQTALAVLPPNDGPSAELRRALERGSLCVGTATGGWGIALGELSAREGEVWGRWAIVHADEQGRALAAIAPDTTSPFGGAGAELPASRQNLQWSPGKRVVPLPPVPYDFDGDGEPELIVLVETTMTAESGRAITMQRGRVWTGRPSTVGLYPPARDIAIESVRDVDGDKRPDLIGRGPFTGFASVQCGSEEPYPVSGPALLFHARADGAFAADDSQALAFARLDCAAPPSPIVVATREQTDEIDFAASARNVACARLWGVPEAALLAAIGDRCRTAADAGCPRCDDRALLERWAHLPAPLRLGPPAP